jgi:hypothetical protein
MSCIIIILKLNLPKLICAHSLEQLNKKKDSELAQLVRERSHEKKVSVN